MNANTELINQLTDYGFRLTICGSPEYFLKVDDIEFRYNASICLLTASRDGDIKYKTKVESIKGITGAIDLFRDDTGMSVHHNGVSLGEYEHKTNLIKALKNMDFKACFDSVEVYRLDLDNSHCLIYNLPKKTLEHSVKAKLRGLVSTKNPQVIQDKVSEIKVVNTLLSMGFVKKVSKPLRLTYSESGLEFIYNVGKKTLSRYKGDIVQNVVTPATIIGLKRLISDSVSKSSKGLDEVTQKELFNAGFVDDSNLLFRLTLEHRSILISFHHKVMSIEQVGEQDKDRDCVQISDKTPTKAEVNSLYSLLTQGKTLDFESKPLKAGQVVVYASDKTIQLRGYVLLITKLDQESISLFALDSFRNECFEFKLNEEFKTEGFVVCSDSLKEFYKK